MRRTFLTSAAVFPSLKSGKELFTKLWSKPETKDERVKQYVPEVLEESLTEQRKVLEETTSRDKIVEAGHRALQLIENKAATPSIAPHIQQILLEFGTKDLVGQRALSQLLYPSSSHAAVEQSELIVGFVENFKNMIGYIEEHGRSMPPKSAAPAAQGVSATSSDRTQEGGATTTSASETADGSNTGEGEKPEATVVSMAKAGEFEPPDHTLFVKVAAGLGLTNIHAGDFAAAHRCCDVALRYAVEAKRIGGLWGMKAGIFNRQKRFAEAHQAATAAIAASDNVQGYLHGAAALRALKRDAEVLALLERAKEAHPHSEPLLLALKKARQHITLALPEGPATSEPPKGDQSEPPRIAENAERRASSE